MLDLRKILCAALSLILPQIATQLAAQEIAGLTVTPHRASPQIKWRRPASADLACRVELFLRNPGTHSIAIRKGDGLKFDGQSPQELVMSNAWAWHDSPPVWSQASNELSPESLTVIAFNGMAKSWGVDTEHSLQLNDSGPALPFKLESPATWLSAITFLAADEADRLSGDSFPNRLVVHVTHTGAEPLAFVAVRLYLPAPEAASHVFELRHEFTNLECFPADSLPPGPSHGGLIVRCDDLPRSFAVIEVRLKSPGGQNQSLWSYLKIKPEAFDISGGWIASDIGGRNSLTIDEYLRTLKRMHINTGQIEEVAGYSDDPELYAKYPFKRFNRMQDLSRYDRDEVLPTIHAVEFIGEPQYGGGRPIPAQEVWELLAPYRSSRLPTSVTLSEERTWRHYAGLSDYPHYDAYRVIAPAADAWSIYDRWDGQRIRWGAPLETIGEMTRSLREHSRPRPIAYWSQGAHDGWGGGFRSRRGSPTPAELRSQAWHGLSNRITSLYWFNLSLKSLAKFPDLIEPIARVGREIRLLEEIFLWGHAIEHRRIEANGTPAWELNLIAAPQAALLTIHDVAYKPDAKDNVFVFEPRRGEWSCELPSWLGESVDVFAIDAAGIRNVDHTLADNQLTVRDTIDIVGNYVIAKDRSLRAILSVRHAALLKAETDLGFDPAGNATDRQRLQTLAETNR